MPGEVIRNRAVVGLITDFGIQDPYDAVMKGVIYSINPEANIVDITHYVEPQNVVQAAFILSRVYSYFPKDTVFNVVVDPGVGGQRRALAVKAGDYYFVAPDNGVLTLVLEKTPPDVIVEITDFRFILQPVSRTFHGRDIFAPAAAHLSNRVPVTELGMRVEDFKKMPFPPVKVENKRVEGHVIYTDRFGNLITDLDQEIYRGRQIKAVDIAGRTIRNVNRSYDSSPAGELLAITGSFGSLEISVNKGSAREYLNRGTGLPVAIEFLD